MPSSRRCQPSFLTVCPRQRLALQFLMRRNSVYVAFILGGALAGERVSFCCFLTDLAAVGSPQQCVHEAALTTEAPPASS